MEYFYVAPGQIRPTRLEIHDEEFNHLRHVMRKNVGDRIIVVDGTGNLYEATIEEISRHAAHCRVTAHRVLEHEPGTELTLAVSILRNASRFDVLVEKATEIGVRTIVPLRTERTIPLHAKTGRWHAIALSAMKQCGRCVVPAVRELTPLSDFLAASGGPGLKFIAHEGVQSPTLYEALRSGTGSSCVVCIGPEGGFTDAELLKAAAAGFTPVGLGRRRLRAETAAIVAAALVLTSE